MDRKLSRKEKIKAKSKRAALLAVILAGWLGLFIFGSNHIRISEEIGKLRAAISDVINVASMLVDSFKPGTESKS